PRYREWLAIAGTDWNLYIATYEMSSSTAAQREAVERQIAREYPPEFNYPAPTPETHSLKAFMLAQALRSNKSEREGGGAMLKFEELAVQPGFVPRSAGTEEPSPAAFRRVTVEDKKVINSKADV